jgi:hypothetical protein
MEGWERTLYFIPSKSTLSALGRILPDVRVGQKQRDCVLKYGIDILVTSAPLCEGQQQNALRPRPSCICLS